MTEAIPEIEIVQYRDDMAEALAEMYNSWDELWPGGYTRGVPYTADTVRQSLGKMNAIAIFIALDAQTRKPLGSCTLHVHPRDRDAAYVGTLGVRPEALNRRVGKRLLLRCLEMARSLGYKRVDLNTWAGNLRAVPLYKKVGMMWNPESQGLRMEDYIPGIIEHPLCKPFFDKMPPSETWYDTHRRTLEQAPDDVTIDDMMVYPYRFESGANWLQVIIDRYARGITAVDRSVNGERLRVAARLNRHLTLCGIRSKYILTVENHTKKTIKVDVRLEAFKELRFNTPTSTRLILAPGSTTTWEVDFVLDADAPLHRRDIRTPTIVSKLDIDGQQCELHTGMVIRPVAEVMSLATPARVNAGGTVNVPLTIAGAAPFEMSGTLYVETPKSGLIVHPQQTSIVIPPMGLAGTSIEVRADDRLARGGYALNVYMELKSEGTTEEEEHTVVTRRFAVPIYCLNDGVSAIYNDIRRAIEVVSENYIAQITEEGAILDVASIEPIRNTIFGMRSEIGPPFGLSTFIYTERQWSIKNSENSLVVALSARHPDHPFIVEDRYIFEHNSRVILHELWVTNTGNSACRIQARIMGLGGGFRFGRGRVIAPLRLGLTESSMSDMSFSYPALSSKREDWAEGWFAVSTEWGYNGQIWDLDSVEEIRLVQGMINALLYPPTEIAGKATVCLSRVWCVTGVPHWRKIRELWHSKVKKRYDIRRSIRESEQVRPAVQIEIPSCILADIQPVKTVLRVRDCTMASIRGRLMIDPPDGWTAELTLQNGQSVTGKDIVVEDFLIEGEKDLPLIMRPVRPVDQFAVHHGRLSFQGGIELTATYSLLQLGRRSQSVRVTEEKRQGLHVFRITNGLIEYTVSPEYGGCLFSLKNSHRTELLVSNFPRPGPKAGGFMENYYGGIQPFIWDEEMGDSFQQAATNREKMSATECSNDIWRGVAISWIGEIQRSGRGIAHTIEYLTAPGSPLLVVRWHIVNDTTAPVRFIPTFMIDAAFGGDVSSTVYRLELDGTMRDIYPSELPIIAIPTQNIIWMRKGDSDRNTEGIAVINDSDTSALLLITMGDQHYMGMLDFFPVLMPEQRKTITMCVFVDPASENDIIQLKRMFSRLSELNITE